MIGTTYSILINDESKKLAQGSNKQLKDLDVGDKFSMELFQGELLEELQVKQYTSGNAFLNL